MARLGRSFPVQPHYQHGVIGVHVADADTASLVLTASSTETYIWGDDGTTVALTFTPSVPIEKAYYRECPPNLWAGFAPDGVIVNFDFLSDPNVADAQRFVASSTGVTRTVAMFLRRSNSPVDNFLVEIRTDVAGKPGALLASGTFPGSSLNTIAQEITIPVSGASLVNGTTYWILGRRTGVTDSTNLFAVGATTSYPPYDGYNWSISGQLLFNNTNDFWYEIRYTDQATDAHLTLTPSGVDAYSPPSPFPYGVTVLEDFNRDNENPLANGTWAQGRNVAGGNAVRTYTQNAGGASSGFNASRWTGGTFLDTVAYVDLVTPPSGTTEEWVAIYARQTPDTNHSAYEVAVTRTGASTWKAEIFDEKGAGHTFTQRAVDTATTWASGDKLGIRVTGSGATVTVELWRYTAGAWQLTPLLTWNDTAADRLVVAGEVEVEMQGTTGRIDNFGVPFSVAPTTDAATVPLLFTPSGVDLPARDTTDAATTTLAFIPSSTELREAVEAATVAVKFTPDRGYERAVFIDPAPDISSGFTANSLEISAFTGLQDPNTPHAQAFIAPSSNVTRTIALLLLKQNNPVDNVIVEIRSDTAGKPGTVLASSILPAANITNVSGKVTTFDVSGASLISGNTYWIVVNRTGSSDATNVINIYGSTLFPPYNGYTWNISPNTVSPNNLDWYFDLRFVDQAADAHLTLTPSGVEAYERTDAATVSLTFTPSVGFAKEAVVFVDGIGKHGFIEAFSSGSITWGNTSAVTMIAQSFVLPADGHAISIDMKGGKSATPTDGVIAEIRSDNAGNPSATILATSDELLATNMGAASSSINRYYIEYDLIGGTIYWIVFRRTGALDSNNSYTYGDIPTGYPGNARYWNGTVWASVGVSIPYTVNTRISSLIAQLALTSSGTDIYTPLTGAVTTDADTASLVFTPSATEVAADVDAATATLVFTASGAEIQASVEAATTPAVFTPSGTDVKAQIEAATAALLFTPSAAEIREIPDAATGTLAFTPSSTEAQASVDAASQLLVLAVSGSEFRTQEYIEAATTSLVFTPSSTEVRERVDASTETLTMTPSAVDVLASTDSLTSTVKFVPSAVEGRESTEASTTALTLIPSMSEVLASTEASAVPLALTASSGETLASVDTATERLVFTPSGIDFVTGVGVDVGTVALVLTASAAELRESVEASTANVLLVPGGVSDVLASTDSQIAPITLQPSGTEAVTRVLVDADTAFVQFTASGTDVYTSVAIDVGTVALHFTPSAAEIAGVIESAEVRVAFTVISTDVTVFGDISEALIQFAIQGDELVQISEIGLARLIFSIDAQEQLVPSILPYALEVVRMYTQYRVIGVQPAYSSEIWAHNRVATTDLRYEPTVPFRRYWWKGRG